MRDRDVLEARAVAVRDGLDLHDLALALAQAVAGELAERPLGRARSSGRISRLDHHLGVRGHEHVRGLAAHQLERLAEQAPMIARSSSSIEPMASAPSAIAGCTPMAKATGRGWPRASAIRWNSHRCLPGVRWMEVVSRPWIISRL